MCVKNLPKVALDSATAGIEPATSSRKTNALTTAPPSHRESFIADCRQGISCQLLVGDTGRTLFYSV